MDRTRGDSTTRIRDNGETPQLYVYVMHWMKGNISGNESKKEDYIRELVCHTTKKKKTSFMWMHDRGIDDWFTQGLWRPDAEQNANFHLQRRSGFAGHLFTTVVLYGDGSKDNDTKAIQQAVQTPYDYSRSSAVVVWKIPLCTNSTVENPIIPPCTAVLPRMPLKSGLDLVFQGGSPPAFMCLGIFKKNLDGHIEHISYPDSCLTDDTKELISAVKLADKNRDSENTPSLSSIYNPSNWKCL